MSNYYRYKYIKTFIQNVLNHFDFKKVFILCFRYLEILLEFQNLTNQNLEFLFKYSFFENSTVILLLYCSTFH